MKELEADLIAHLAPADVSADTPALFILGAPRTGSTILYQLLVSAFHLAYFSNLIDEHFPESPVIGLAMQHAVGERVRIAFESRYGKSEGLLQPSEASHVMRHWFGGGHPSQIVSAQILPGKGQHLVKTVASAYALFSRPLVIKNAWNCFRVASLASLLPTAFFLWIRRDIAAAAKSDLHARYAVQGSPYLWNSATPANLDELRTRPYWEQVVENQYEFSAALARSMGERAQERHIEIWYEDFCAHPKACLEDLGARWSALGPPANLGERWEEIRSSAEHWDLTEEDSAAVDRYIEAHQDRLSRLRYAERPSEVQTFPVQDPVRSARPTGSALESTVAVGSDGAWKFKSVTPATLGKYLKFDWVRARLSDLSQPEDDALTTQRWLVESPAKRHIFADLYGDLLQSEGTRVLDIGGGLSAFTREFARRHRYELVELMAHEVRGVDANLYPRFPGCCIHVCDWLDYEPDGVYDLIVANDLFPNVDQRLELFLRKFLPRCREIRLSLTYFAEPRFYRTRRIDGDEILFMLAWSWEQIHRVLGRLGCPPSLMQGIACGPHESVFPNRRQILLLSAVPALTVAPTVRYEDHP